MKHIICKILLLFCLCSTQFVLAQFPTMRLPKKTIKTGKLNTSNLHIIQKKNTTFNVNTHGFLFANTFKNNFISEVDFRTSGQCGGMVYTALDYFLNNKTRPTQDYVPAEHTDLRKHIYHRQVHSIVDNIDKWIEVGFNPGGARNSEFFEWGLKGKDGGRLEELKKSIDQNKPVPLGLYGTGGSSAGGDHQVMAIGYDLGRYKGDLGAYKEEVKIFVYDPNYPKKIRTLRPNITQKYYYYEEDTDCKWRTYFVDKKYRPRTAPTFTPKNYPKDGKAHELIVTFHTGGDDLRGKHDNLNVTINFFDGTSQTVNNINRGYRWIDHYEQTVSIPLSRPVPCAEIKNMILQTTFGGGIGGDNWNMDGLVVRAFGGNVDELIYNRHNSPLFRFTGDRKRFTASINNTGPAPSRNKTRELMVEIHTSNDDLRGGSDNLNIHVHYTDGTKQTFKNVNKSNRWPDNTTKNLSLTLNKEVYRTQIKNVVLETTFGGGIGGDNWNMKWLVIVAEFNGAEDQLYLEQGEGGKPLFRFTGDRKRFTASL